MQGGLNSTVILWFDLKVITTKGFSTVSYTEKKKLYNILKVPKNLMRGKHRKLVINSQKIAIN